MKSTGIVRRVDDLGRVVIPIELRRTLGIGDKEELEIYVDGDQIILRKPSFRCLFCNSEEHVTVYKRQSVCHDCLDELRSEPSEDKSSTS